MHIDNIAIRKTLSSLESDFFSALQYGTDTLKSYHRSWQNFNAEVQTCTDLDENTTLDIFNFATTASRIASAFLEVTTTGEQYGQEFENDMYKLIGEKFGELSIQDKPTSQPDTTTPHAPYIPLAYKWLLENLHNPYPTKDIRLQISTATSSSPKDIDAWFIDARKRIGWNQLRKNHFAKRADLIKAATQFFRPTPSVLSPPTPMLHRAKDAYRADFSSDFVHIEALAHQLYSDKLFPSSLASNLERPAIESVNRHSTENRSQKQRQRSYGVDHGTSYPSPSYSSSGSPSPLPDGQPVESVNRKRSRPSPEPPSEEEQPSSRVAKRKRCDAPHITIESAITSLPSPAASVDDVHADDIVFSIAENHIAQSLGKRKNIIADVDDRPKKRLNTGRLMDEASVDESSCIMTLGIQPSERRKRSLSDMSDERPFKRPSARKPDQHRAISEPMYFSAYPNTPPQADLDNWLDDMFVSGYQLSRDIPAPVTEASFDDSSEFEVNYYAYDFSAYSSSDASASSDSPADSPAKLPDAATLPHPQISGVWDVKASAPCLDFGQTTTIPSASWDFSDTPIVPGSDESWQSVLLADMLSPTWTSDSLCIDNALQSSSWTLGDLSSQTTNNIDVSTNTSFVGNLLSPHVLHDDKSLKLHQYHKLLAEAQMLRAELAL